MRILGIDLARFLAIVGMMAAHLLVPRQGGDFGELDWLTVVTSGIPSAMFAVIGGFGIFLTSRKYLDRKAPLGATINLLVRGGLIALLGLALSLLPDHPIALILIFFGAAIVCAAPLILLPSWVLAFVAAGLPFLGAIVGYQISQELSLRTIFDASTASEVFYALFFTGYYPVVTWLSYLLIGLVAARYLLGGAAGQIQRRAGLLTAVGALAFVSAQLLNLTVLGSAKTQMVEIWGVDASAGPYLVVAAHRGVPHLPPPQSLLLAAPHSGSPADVFNTAGITLMITGTLVLVTETFKVIGRILLPAAWIGAIPLTAYSLHIVMTSFSWTQAQESQALTGTYPPWFAVEFWIQLALITAVGVAVGLSKRRGPLESVVSTTAETIANSVQPPSSIANQ